MRTLKAADLFCGAGGFTTGAQQAGIDVVLAINHWRTAIFTHQANHPAVRHLCARIEHVDARNDTTLPAIDLLMASPECTHHSIARGGRPVSDQKRQQPFALLDWIDAKRPRWVLVENVREFRGWGPLRNEGTDARPKWRPDPKRKGETFAAWIRAIEACGYQVDHQILNAADFGAPTKRQRLFVLARRGRSRKDIPWPAPSHADGWRGAFEIIDWTIPCRSVFDRRPALAENTLYRIEMGVRRFVGPFVATLRRNMVGSDCASPLATITAGAEHHALCIPFQFKAIGRRPGITKDISEPLPTIVAARENHAIVIPFLSQYHNGVNGNKRNHAVGEPLRTIDTENRYALCMPYLMAVNHGGADDRSHSLAEPMATLTTKNGHAIVIPWLTKYYGTAIGQAAADPLAAITTHDRFALTAAQCRGGVCHAKGSTPAMKSLLATCRELGIDDIGYRMLSVEELAMAQGFPAGYHLFGNRGDQVRQVGNAVCPPVARALCETIVAA